MTDLNSLTAQGVRIVGRLGRPIHGRAQFSASLPNICAHADLKMNRFLNRADEWAAASGPGRRAPAAAPLRAHPRRSPHARWSWTCRSGEITTVLWATGLPARPLLARHPGARPQRAASATTAAWSPSAPGLYVLGLPVLRTRASTYIHGAG